MYACVCDLVAKLARATNSAEHIIAQSYFNKHHESMEKYPPPNTLEDGNNQPWLSPTLLSLNLSIPMTAVSVSLYIIYLFMFYVTIVASLNVVEGTKFVFSYSTKWNRLDRLYRIE